MPLTINEPTISRTYKVSAQVVVVVDVELETKFPHLPTQDTPIVNPLIQLKSRILEEAKRKIAVGNVSAKINDIKYEVIA